MALTRQTFVGKVISQLLNLLSRLVITFSSKEQATECHLYSTTNSSNFILFFFHPESETVFQVVVEHSQVTEKKLTVLLRNWEMFVVKANIPR